VGQRPAPRLRVPRPRRAADGQLILVVTDFIPARYAGRFEAEFGAKFRTQFTGDVVRAYGEVGLYRGISENQLSNPGISRRTRAGLAASARPRLRVGAGGGSLVSPYAGPSR